MSDKTRMIANRAARVVLAALLLVLAVTHIGLSRRSDADPEAVLAAVTAQLDMSLMQQGDTQMVKRLYGADPAAYEFCALYYPVTNMGADELLLVKLPDGADAEALIGGVNARLETQKNTFEGYGPQQYALLTEHCVIDDAGNYFLFVVSANDRAADDAFRAALKGGSGK